MGWAKFDDKRHTSTKLAAARLEANGLDANGITWCAAHETDGFVEDGALAFIAPGYPTRKAEEIAARLVACGRWERDDEKGGWWVHDYLDYNPSRADLDERREGARRRKEAERQRAVRGKNGKYTANVTARQACDNGVTPSGVRAESPVSRPGPSRPVPTSSSSVSEEPPPAANLDDDESPFFDEAWRRYWALPDDRRAAVSAVEAYVAGIANQLRAGGWSPPRRPVLRAVPEYVPDGLERAAEGVAAAAVATGREALRGARRGRAS